MFSFVYILFLVYFGIVLGTLMKFKENNIRLGASSYFVIPLIPFVLLGFHMRVIIQYLKHGESVSLRILLFPIFNYPMLVGVFIEMLLERKAQQIVLQEKMSKKKRRKSKKVSYIHVINRGRVGVDWDDAISLLKSKMFHTGA
ncbi:MULTISPECIES: hypothetical protein [unclassified Paenibacillus]|uniref:hypothetical protein n=1 Tax=unclassified Paenibacillus TaxID=185978 RepID=UPI0004633EB1|nr:MULTISPECIES: hypothetical protein [unclassified Paenibacillus]KGP80095.1 hypothetical protein P364_0122100 [Paenibacillus sp. MAEPY2]KGP89404.1 hypothetical protein P363_0100190 [Paenibacillus sp. MAEPY1]